VLPVPAVICLAGLFGSFFTWQISRNPWYFWGPAVDAKSYAAVARNVLQGAGFRWNAIDSFEITTSMRSLDCFTTYYFHPLLIAAVMKMRGDMSQVSALYTGVICGVLCIPLAYLILRNFFSPYFALFGTFFFCLLPSTLWRGPTGLSEPVALLLFFIALSSFSHMRIPAAKGIVLGICLGLMNTTRPTGLVLAPAFLYLAFHANRFKGVLLFALFFLLPSLAIFFMGSAGALHYSGVTHFTNMLVGYGALDQVDTVSIAPARRAFQIVPFLHTSYLYLRQALFGMSEYLTEDWIFVPVGMLLIRRKHPEWFVFLLISAVCSFAAVVFYWGVPRYTEHLHIFVVVCILIFLQETYSRGESKRFLVQIAMGLAMVPLFSVSRLGWEAKTLVGVIITWYFFLSASRVSTPKRRNINHSLALSLVLATTVYYLNFHVRCLLNWRQPASPSDFQASAAKLIELGVPRNSIIVSDVYRELPWFLGTDCISWPGRPLPLLTRLETTSRPLYIVLKDPPTDSALAELKQISYSQVFTALPGITVFSREGMKSRAVGKPPG